MRARTFSILTVFVWITSLVVAGKIHAAEMSPDQLVKTTTEEVLSVIKENSDEDKLQKLADAKVVPHFNFRRMTKLAVGRPWNQASPEQQQRLEKEFRELLVRTYTRALATGAHKNVTVDVKPARDASGSEATVQTRVTESGKPPVEIDYRMEKAPDGWKVFDVNVDAVSLVTNYRQSFLSEIQQSGIDGLIKSLTEKNRSRSTNKMSKG